MVCSEGPAISILKALQMFSGIAGVENFSAGGCGEKNKSDIYDAGKGLVTSGDGEKNDYF